MKKPIFDPEYPIGVFREEKHIMCQNSRLESKYSQGFECKIWVNIENRPDVAAVLCRRCTAMLADWPKQALPKVRGNSKPKGWGFMKIYVDEEGNVYKKGILQPELKGLFPPTTVQQSTKTTRKSKKLSSKKTKSAKKKEMNRLLCELSDLKKELRNNSEDEIDLVLKMKLEAKKAEIDKKLNL